MEIVRPLRWEGADLHPAVPFLAKLEMGKAYPSANKNELLPDRQFSHPLLFFFKCFLLESRG
jgi:hypothetical protein